MDKDKRKRLEAAGWKIGTVKEFLGLTFRESMLVELRLILWRIRRWIKRRR